MAPLPTPTRLSGAATAGALFAVLCSSGAGCSGSEEASVTPVEPISVRGELDVDRSDGGVRATVTLHNLASEPALLLRYNLPEDGELTKALFVVQRNGAPVAYRGRAAKRAAPTAADYQTLGAGDRVAAVFELAAAYDFESPGRYAVQYRAFNPQLGSQDLGEVVSNTVEFEVTP